MRWRKRGGKATRRARAVESPRRAGRRRVMRRTLAQTVALAAGAALPVRTALAVEAGHRVRFAHLLAPNVRRPLPMQLLVAVINHAELLDGVLAGLKSLGISGATVLESRGMARLLSRDSRDV